LTESALANAVAAIRAHLRDQPTIADALLTRADQRVNLTDPPLDLRARVFNLTDAIAEMEPQTIDLTQRIRDLLHEALAVDSL
jgi:hypothetical protein